MDLSGATFCKANIEFVNIAELIVTDMYVGDKELINFYDENGYVYIKNVIPRDLVMKAREEILQKYAIIGEVDDREPIGLGISSGKSYRNNVNVRALRQSIVTGYYYQSVSRHSYVQNTVNRILKHESKMLDYLWPRLAGIGSGTALHQDAPFLKGALPSSSLVSVWTPLGDISPIEGALIVLGGSHKSTLLKQEYGNKDVDKENGFGWYDINLTTVQQKIGGQWLTTNFEAGGFIVFDLMTLHGAFDNNSKNKVRLSSDSRYQSTEYPIHERWKGERAVGRSEDRVFLPHSTTINTLLNSDLNTEFHNIDEFGKVV